MLFSSCGILNIYLIFNTKNRQTGSDNGIKLTENVFFYFLPGWIIIADAITIHQGALLTRRFLQTHGNQQARLKGFFKTGGKK